MQNCFQFVLILTMEEERSETMITKQHECFKGLIRVQCTQCDNQCNLRLREDMRRNDFVINSWFILSTIAAVFVIYRLC